MGQLSAVFICPHLTTERNAQNDYKEQYNNISVKRIRHTAQVQRQQAHGQRTGGIAAFVPGRGTTLFYEHEHFEIVPDGDSRATKTAETK
jgi:hypothetical protein